ncbi:MAG: hypothetical protein ACOC97_03665 [Myxococcota bacterium]
MFEHMCGNSTGCAASMGAAIALSLLGAACWLAVTVQAFRAAPVQGVLCLLVPPYAIYYAVARLEHRRRLLLAAGMLLGPLLAFLAFNSATAVFGPDMAAGDPAFDEDFEDEMDTGDDFDDDLGDFDEPAP